MAKRDWFDSAGFHAALDAHRRHRAMNWKQVAAESGVSASSLTRLGQGKNPDVDTLAALTAWAGLSADTFFRSTSRRSEPDMLADVSACLRSNERLTPEAVAVLDELIRLAYVQLRTTTTD